MANKDATDKQLRLLIANQIGAIVRVLEQFEVEYEVKYPERGDRFRNAAPRVIIINIPGKSIPMRIYQNRSGGIWGNKPIKVNKGKQDPRQHFEGVEAIYSYLKRHAEPRKISS